jgi:hypothetical protein
MCVSISAYLLKFTFLLIPNSSSLSPPLLANYSCWTPIKIDNYRNSCWIFEKLRIRLVPCFAVAYCLPTQLRMAKSPVRDTEIKTDSYSFNHRSVLIALLNVLFFLSTLVTGVKS